VIVRPTASDPFPSNDSLDDVPSAPGVRVRRGITRVAASGTAGLMSVGRDDGLVNLRDTDACGCRVGFLPGGDVTAGGG
jgi:hypothetical protein